MTPRTTRLSATIASFHLRDTRLAQLVYVFRYSLLRSAMRDWSAVEYFSISSGP